MNIAEKIYQFLGEGYSGTKEDAIEEINKMLVSEHHIDVHVDNRMYMFLILIGILLGIFISYAPQLFN